MHEPFVNLLTTITLNCSYPALLTRLKNQCTLVNILNNLGLIEMMHVSKNELAVVSAGHISIAVGVISCVVGIAIGDQLAKAKHRERKANSFFNLREMFRDLRERHTWAW